MGIGTKNRQNQTAELCKEHLRSTYASQGTLVAVSYTHLTLPTIYSV